MSKFIPMVSASPPPLDEKEFEWEEEDDDFGKFAGVDDSVVDMDMSNKPHDDNGRNGRKMKDCKNEQEEATEDYSRSQETRSHIVSKPQVQALPLLTDNHIAGNKHSLQVDGESGIENNASSVDQTAQPGSLKRDSDSGMFSTDISPVPVSEDGTMELEVNCDNLLEGETDERTDWPRLHSHFSAKTYEEKQTLNTLKTPSPTEPSSDLLRPVKSPDVVEANPIPKHTDILHDSDEEYDHHSSNILDSLSNRSTESAMESSCMSEEINDDCDFPNNQRVQKNNVMSVSGQKNNSLDEEDVEEDDEFGDFADFSCPSNNYLKTHNFNENIVEKNGDGKLNFSLTNVQDSQPENVSTDKVISNTELGGNGELINNEQLEQKVESFDEKNDFLSESSTKTEKYLYCDGEKKSCIDNCMPISDMNGSSVISKTEDTSDKYIKSDEDEFADFSCASLSGQTGNNNEDFADFSPVPFNSHNGMNLDDDDDDFADFSSVTLPSQTSEVKSQYLERKRENGADGKDAEEDDFSEFSSVKPALKEGDDWAPFSKSDESKFMTSHTIAGLKVLDVDKLQTVIEASFLFDISSSQDTENVLLLDTILIGSTLPQSEESYGKEHSMRKVMKQVFDYDNTNALIYQWKKSQSNDRLFTTLNIDTKNMFFGLKKEVVPLSLKSLTLLEPIRGAIQGKKDKTTEALVEPSMDSLPQLQDMPPVEFDWDNSGLTNPLEAKTLDLDFMGVQENETSTKMGVFQSEILDAPRSSVKPMQPLEDILKTMKLTATTAPSSNKKDDNLSKEAESIIESLPLLSFMKSKVLMFKLQNS